MPVLFWNSLEVIFGYFPTWFSSSLSWLPAIPLLKETSSVTQDLQEGKDLTQQTRDTLSVNEFVRSRVASGRSYYAVALVKDALLENEPALLFVFDSMQDVLSACRAYKASDLRWKRFPTRAKAEKFSLRHTAEQQLAIEDVSSFKAAKLRELDWLRLHIEDGDVEGVRELIETNPRYIIGKGGNPPILQHGRRYNAFHIAARFDRAEIITLILEYLRSPSYIKRLHPRDDDRLINDRIAFIIEMYLNAPEAVNGDTPLHFATKFGSLRSVKVLLAQDECDQDARNRDGQGAEDVICENHDSSWRMDLRIGGCFRQNFVVPVLKNKADKGKPHIMGPVTFQQLQRMFSSPGELSPRLGGFIGPTTSLRATKIMEDIEKAWWEPENIESIRRERKKGVETLIRFVARKHEVPFRQDWPFLNCALDIASESGLVVFNSYMWRKKFVYGDSPSKSDYAVWCALEPFLIEIGDDEFLDNISRWISSMREFSNAEMRLWKNRDKILVFEKKWTRAKTPESCLGLVERYSVEL